MGLENLIANSLDLPPDRPYGAILGLAPSQGARSPVLWRAAFAALGLAADFHPMDVAPADLSKVIAALRADPRFIGGAVAVPYKEALLGELDVVDGLAAEIGAVNAVRRHPGGGLAGANTDGMAALASLEAAGGSVAGRRVLVLGLGGAGKAVAVALGRADAAMAVWNRSIHKARAFAEAASFPVTVVEDPGTVLAETDVLVNCTSAGFAADAQPNDTAPLDLALLARLPASAMVFDVVYQPLRTALLCAAEARGLSILGGKDMNLRQAVIAFGLAFPMADSSQVQVAMAAV